MDSKIPLFLVLALAVVAIMAPVDYAFAESTETEDEEHRDYKGKSCPSKENKSASYNPLAFL